MHTEDPHPPVPEGPAPPARRRRRRPWAVATMAAAVVLAGGGGTYWAVSSTGGDTRESVPRALRLDDQRTGELAAGTGRFAPGEPPPAGVRYQAPAHLPPAPRHTLPVYRPHGEVPRAAVTRLATALGLSGQPRLKGDVWTVTDGRGDDGPTLRVRRKDAGGWSYTRAPGADGCSSSSSARAGGTGQQPPGSGSADSRCATSAPGDGDRSSPAAGPVSAKRATAAAAPVFRALRLDGTARRDASQHQGAVRTVTADPVLGGVPSQGWQTAVRVGADGRPVSASGLLATPHGTAGYPLIGAAEAVSRLNADVDHAARPTSDTCATSVPQAGPAAGSAGQADGASSVTAAGDGVSGCPTPAVRRATLGRPRLVLAARPVDGHPALVPSWQFTARTAGERDGRLVVRPAVHPDYIAAAGSADATAPPTARGGEPTAEAPRRSVRITSYHASGDRLTVRFWGGVCDRYRVTADESGAAVKVRVTAKPERRECVAVAREFQRTVTLERPRADREVLDASNGAPVPAHRPGGSPGPPAR